MGRVMLRERFHELALVTFKLDRCGRRAFFLGKFCGEFGAKLRAPSGHALGPPSEIDIVARFLLWRRCLGRRRLEKPSRFRLQKRSWLRGLALRECWGRWQRLLEPKRYPPFHFAFVKGMHVLFGGRAPLDGKSLRDFGPRFAAAPQCSDRFPMGVELGLEWFSWHEVLTHSFGVGRQQLSALIHTILSGRLHSSTVLGSQAPQNGLSKYRQVLT